MGRFLLCGRTAELPYEVEELDLRLYTIEELCYYIYHNLALISDDFIDERLLHFITDELGLTEIAEKIRRFYISPSDQDATLLMLLREVGYYTETELQDFQNRLVDRRRKNGPERTREKARVLSEKKRYRQAILSYRSLLTGERDGRLSAKFYTGIREETANCCGRLCAFDEAFLLLSEIYDETRSERILKKMYDVRVLSGEELPEEYFGRVPDEKLNSWQQDYWNRENVLKGNIERDPSMQLFLKEPEKMQKDLKNYVEKKKEEYRGMLE